MTFWTNLGNFEFYLAILPLIYWSIHKRFATHLIYVIIFASFIMSALKHTFRLPRPFWINRSIGLDTRDLDYGFPSGHTMLPTVMYTMTAYWAKRNWVTLLAAIAIFFIAFSRIFLGVHFIQDILFGFLLGLSIVAAYIIYIRNYNNTFQARNLGQRWLIALAIPLILGAVYLILQWLSGGADNTAVYHRYVAAAELEGYESTANSFGLLLGAGTGMVLERSRVRFVVDGPWWQRIGRYLVGMVGMVAIWRGLGSILPEDPFWLALPLRIARYTLLGLWAAYYAPMLMVKLKLMSALPETEFEISLRAQEIEPILQSTQELRAQQLADDEEPVP